MGISNSTCFVPYFPTRTLMGEHREFITCLAFSASGAYLASASQDGVVTIWGTTDGAQISSFQLGTSALALAWDTRQQFKLFVGCMDGTAVHIDNLQVGVIYYAENVYIMYIDCLTGPTLARLSRPISDARSCCCNCLRRSFDPHSFSNRSRGPSRYCPPSDR